MKLSLAQVAFGSTLVSQAYGHYLVNRLIIDGQTSGKWQYNLESTKGLMPTKGDDIKSDTFRCGPGAFDKSASTQVAKVAAGAEMAFKLGDSVPIISHPGPITISLSKAPGSVKSYKGDGDWFTIHQDAICGDVSGGITDTDWCSYHKSESKFTIPAATPPGEYLIRWQHLGLHGAHEFKGTEFFFGCAQIEVTGNGNGSPSPVYKIPSNEFYDFNDPGIHYSIWSRKTTYPLPGPATWNASSSAAAPQTPVTPETPVVEEPSTPTTSLPEPVEEPVETPVQTPVETSAVTEPTPVESSPSVPSSSDSDDGCAARRRRRHVRDIYRQ